MKKDNKIILSFTTILILTSNLYAKEAKKLDSVTVTAQKVEEKVIDVPITMSVLDEYAIEDKGIQTISDLANSTPGFYLFNISGNGTASPTIRGIHSDYRTISSSVSMYVDGIPTFNTNGYNTVLEDIERIEVLKGPQGTLYGKNAQAGVINIITKKPDNETRGKVTVELAEDKKRQVGFSASGAVVEDKFFIGISGRYYEKDGFIKNEYLNKNANDRKNYQGKINLRYEVNDNLDFSLIASKLKRKDGGGSANKVTSENLRKSKLDLDEKNDAENLLSGFKINYNLDNKTIESITAYKKDQLFIADDYDKSINTKFKAHAFFDTKSKNLSQELRYKVKEDNLTYLLGLYLDKNQDLNKNDFDTAMGRMLYTDQKIDSKSIGVFAHLDYKFNDKLSLLTGLRYDKTKSELDNKIRKSKREKDFSEVSPKIAFKYQINKDNMLFANIAKGYKAGGFYMFAPQNNEYYDKETLYSYEIGLKSFLFDGRLNLNNSIYYIDLSDKQVVVPINSRQNYIKNAESAKSQGFEFEATFLATQNLTLYSSFSYNKAKFKKFKYSTVVLDKSNKVVGTQNYDNSNNVMPYAPKYTYNLGFQYRLNNFLINAYLNGFGKYYIDDANKYEQKAYSLFNAKIGYESDSYDIYLYGKNIFDKDYSTKEHYGANYVLLSDPREIGVKFVYRF